MNRTTGAISIVAALVLAGCSGTSNLPGSVDGPGTSPPSVSVPGTQAPSSASAKSSGSTLDRVTQSKRLRICTTGDYRPFTYLDPKSKTWSGIDVSMAKDLAELLGAKPEFVQVTWDTLLKDVKSKCDIGVGGISITTDRAQEVFLSDPTLRDGKTPITLCDQVADYDTIGEINRSSVKVITPVGGTNEKFADEHFSKAHIIKWKNNNTIFKEIEAGRADVMVTDASETKWVAHKNPKLCAVSPDKPFTFSQQGYLVHRGDMVMLEFVNKWLNIAKHDGTYAAAEKPWFG